MIELETIETDRLLLKRLTPSVYDHIFSTYTREEQMDFFGFETAEELQTETDKYEEGLSMFNRDMLLFQLIHKREQRVIGWCGYHTWYRRHRRAELGYVLNREAYRQQGLMSEALAAVIAYGFQEMVLNRIEALVGPENLPSLKLLHNNGFTLEGRLRQHYVTVAQPEDSLMYGLLKEEYLKRADSKK